MYANVTWWSNRESLDNAMSRERCAKLHMEQNLMKN